MAAAKKQKIYDAYAEILRSYDLLKKRYYLRVVAQTDSGNIELLSHDKNSKGADKFITAMKAAETMNSYVVTIYRFENLDTNKDAVEMQTINLRSNLPTGEKVVNSQYEAFGGLQGFIQKETELGQMKIEVVTKSNILAQKTTELQKAYETIEKTQLELGAIKSNFEQYKEAAKEKLEELKDKMREQRIDAEDKLRDKDREFRDHMTEHQRQVIDLQNKASIWTNLSGSLEKVATTVVGGLAGLPFGGAQNNLAVAGIDKFQPQNFPEVEAEEEDDNEPEDLTPPEISEVIINFENWLKEENDVDLAQNIDSIIRFLMTDKTNVERIVNEIENLKTLQNG